MDISTKEAAKRLQVSPQRVLVMLRDGQLTGRQLGRTWLVDEASVTARLTLSTPAGPPWSMTTIVRILDALSGHRPLPPRERSLVERLDAEELAAKVGQAVVVRRYTTRWPEDVAQHLALTGESAIERIAREPSPKLHASFHGAHGYARRPDAMQLLEHAARLVPDPDGMVFVYTFKTREFPWEHTPAALIATDCARSLATRVRSVGLTALEEMRHGWLQSTD